MGVPNFEIDAVVEDAAYQQADSSIHDLDKIVIKQRLDLQAADRPLAAAKLEYANGSYTSFLTTV
ncbi:MAG TPA: hypothetical protein VGK34_02775 [Armatimonadota bacterium]|jgi:hypothetical protein